MRWWASRLRNCTKKPGRCSLSWCEEKWLTARGVVGFYPAVAEVETDTVVVDPS